MVSLRQPIPQHSVVICKHRLIGNFLIGLDFQHCNIIASFREIQAAERFRSTEHQ